ncbi:cysteine/serine-rich nuclear protein 2-like [Thalassophryne amazonica]|uniref:cysteine/serine-rich nuclear protein 2-like n=1 Tax=Thalassophryne amazonica TaxID=390379 RepID=UPI00147260D0|nr:cysteine/serine-rich nuclear protein 2-like [Thalassophryne amazonica]
MIGQHKRKFEELTEDQGYSSPTTLDSSPNNPAMPSLKRTKKTHQTRVTFGQVMIFLFSRCQGFTAVPSEGGCTLGMMPHHNDQQTYTVDHYDKKQDYRRREILWEGLTRIEEQGRLPEVKEHQQDGFAEHALKMKAGYWEKRFFPQRYKSERRYSLLKAAGVEFIDREEETQLQDLRSSRRNVGCDCKGHCDPLTCSCSLAGVKCHAKRTALICNCTEDCCRNIQGRIPSNKLRVRAHYQRTIMRLKSERRTPLKTPD